MGAIRTELTLEPHGPAAAFALSDAEVAEVGEGARTFLVRVTIGDYVFQGRLARRSGENLIGLSRAARETGDLEIGTRYTIAVELDATPREVDVPMALALALQEEGLEAAFEARSPSQRKEWARSVADAKQEETRTRRVVKVLDALR